MDQQHQKRSFTGFLSRSDRSLLTRVDSASSDVSGLSLSESEKGDLGLTTLHTPANGAAAVADIIFIHGLGGGSRKSWSYSRDEYHYWPQSWLPSDPDFENVRVHAFGYAADWTERQQSALNINDFAQSLLGEIKNSPGIRRDATLIVLVGHSMGGCVAKKAYILARQDPACRDLVNRIHSMFFLGTPHRGSDLALILENMLTVAWGRKPFVKDLLPNSNTLTDINDAFRHYAPDLKLWSFYETQPVKTKLMNKLVVEKLSSTLGFPNEEISAMNADHRHVCKFESPTDSNYRLLRNALHTAVDMIRESTGAEEGSESFQSREAERAPAGETSAKLLSFLGLGQALEDDFTTLQILKEQGSCEWFTKRASYAAWADRTGSHILWLTGRPATGKSVLSSHVADELRLSGSLCSHFIFKHGKSNKSTLSDCFRSLAYQMSLHDAFIRERLLKMAEDATSWDRSDETSIWRKLFVGVIFQSPLLPQHAWVIDGLDECSNFNTLFTKKLLATVPPSLRIFHTSRDLEEVGRGLAALGSRVHIHALSEQDTFDDMRLFLTTKLSELDRLETDEKRHQMCEKILHKSRGSFLWVRLVLQNFETAWTEEAMEVVLQDVPSDLGHVYHRILQSIEADPRKKILAKSILSWVVLASRPLSTDELRCAIKLDVGQTVQNINRAVPSLCGQLVFIDQSNKVQIIHETAREFLLARDLDSDLAIPKAHAHARLSLLLVRYLSSNAMKVQSATEAPKGRARGFASARSTSAAAAPDLGLLAYAAYFFSDHIYRCTSEDDLLIEEICQFLKSQNVLSWIEHVARGQDLSHLTRTATNLRGYLCRRVKYVSPTDPQVHLVDGWVIDFIRVAAKFRSQLLACPSSIHCLIPPLCPPDSNISKTTTTEIRHSPLVVKNLPSGTWDDCLIRIDFTKGQATAVAHGDEAFAVGLSTGRVLLYSPVSLQQSREFSHPERVRLLEFSPGCDYLVSCGSKHLFVWDVKAGASMFLSGLQSGPLSATFLSDGELLTASPTSELTKWNFHTGEQETISWLGLDDYEPPATGLPDQSPSKVAFSGPLPDYDALLAVGYRNHPVLIWDPMELQLLGRCEAINANGVDTMVFNPNYEIPALVVSYADGSLCVFDYTTLNLDTSRPNVHANSLACSKDGRSVACGTSQGAIHIYEFDQGYAGNIILAPIYRINSLEDAIRGVAFHFEGLRFVDITRRQCRVWEPAALVRRDNEVESTSDVVSLPQRTVGAVSAPDQPHVSSPLATSKDGRFIVGGNSNGQVLLFSPDDGSELGTAYSHARGASIGLVALADSGRVVSSADDSGRIIVAELPHTLHTTPGKAPSPNLALKIILDRKFGRVVSQLLIGPEANRLLVVSPQSTELWELPQGTLLRRHRLAIDGTPTGNQVKSLYSENSSVIQHPSKPTSFIAMAEGVGRVFSWVDFKELTTPDGIQLLYPTPLDLSTPGDGFCHSIPGVGVLEHRTPSPSPAAQLVLWPITAFDEESDILGQPLKDDGLGALGPAVRSVLGVIGGTRIIFLDSNLWICSFDLRLSSSSHKRSRSISPGPLSGRSRTPAPDQNTISYVRRHFFAMSEWRDGGNKLNSLMVPSRSRPSRSGGHDFAFVAGHRVVLVQGGLDFSETVTLGSPERVSRSEGVGWTLRTDRTPKNSSSSQHWTVVSGSMHRRSSNW